MQRIIQVNIAGRVIPIEENAYNLLRNYSEALSRQFNGPDGKEIMEDIENRVAELFTIRLQSGVPAINEEDVRKVIETLGAPADLNENTYQGNSQSQGAFTDSRSNGRRSDRLLRDPYDKTFGGVCSGFGYYFDIDPTIIRILFVALAFAGIGVVAYIICWAVIPAARSRSELITGQPVTFHDVTRNVAMELEDLKRRAEMMSRDLKDYFGKKR